MRVDTKVKKSYSKWGNLAVLGLVSGLLSPACWAAGSGQAADDSAPVLEQLKTPIDIIPAPVAVQGLQVTFPASALNYPFYFFVGEIPTVNNFVRKEYRVSDLEILKDAPPASNAYLPAPGANGSAYTIVDKNGDGCSFFVTSTGLVDNSKLSAGITPCIGVGDDRLQNWSPAKGENETEEQYQQRLKISSPNIYLGARNLGLGDLAVPQPGSGKYKSVIAEVDARGAKNPDPNQAERSFKFINNTQYAQLCLAGPDSNANRVPDGAGFNCSEPGMTVVAQNQAAVFSIPNNGASSKAFAIIARKKSSDDDWQRLVGYWSKDQKIDFTTKFEYTAYPLNTAPTTLDISMVDGYNDFNFRLYPSRYDGEQAIGAVCQRTNAPDDSYISAGSIFDFYNRNHPMAGATIPGYSLLPAEGLSEIGIQAMCPEQNLVKDQDGQAIGCMSDCKMNEFMYGVGSDQYNKACCKGNYGEPSACISPSNNLNPLSSQYVQGILNGALSSYSFAYDDKNGTFTCDGNASYVIEITDGNAQPPQPPKQQFKIVGVNSEVATDSAKITVNVKNADPDKGANVLVNLEGGKADSCSISGTSGACEVDFTGLTEKTTYQYKVGASSQNSQGDMVRDYTSGNFTTKSSEPPAEEKKTYTIILPPVYSDIKVVVTPYGDNSIDLNLDNARNGISFDLPVGKESTIYGARSNSNCTIIPQSDGSFVIKNTGVGRCGAMVYNPVGKQNYINLPADF